MTVSRASSGSSWLLPTLALLFLASGFSALVYQVLWTRLLSLVFGVTIHAASAVLASYMAGLAVGSLLAGWLGDRVRSPLRWFGYAEVFIGLTALASPFAIAAVQDAYVALHPALEGNVWVLTGGRFLMASLVLLVPTMLMGATLPLVVKSSLTRVELLGSRAGLLYATNTTGAILGTLAAGFLIIPAVGIRASFFIAASLNVAIGIVAVMLAPRATRAIERAMAVSLAEAPAAAAPAASADLVVSPATRAVVLVVFAVSGFVALALEVVWFRVLALFLGQTVYAFTIMLAAVLAGIALGSAVVSPFMQRRLDWVGFLGLTEIGIGVAALLSFSALARSYDLVVSLRPRFEGPVEEYFVPLVLTSFFSIFPAALLMGVAFPVGLRLWAAGRDRERHTARRIGVFYSLNVCGAILGSLAAAFLLLPLLGSRGSVVLLTVLSALGGLALFATMANRRRALALAVAGSAAFVLAWSATPDPFAIALERLYRGDRTLWREEGVQATVAIHERGRGRDQFRLMLLDGRHQANDNPPTLFVHRRIGQLPVALHPNPRRALVVGLGGGATPGAVALDPDLTVDVVELSAAVVRGAEWFSHANFDLLRRPNANIVVDDGRNYLMLTDRRYDVITADIIQPHHAGANNLYSAEYFRLVRRVLDYDGIVLQWVGSSSEAEYKLIMRTFMSVFRHTTLWGDGSLMIGTRHPLRISRAAFERKLADPRAAEALTAIGLTSFDRLRTQFIAGPEELRAFVGEGPILTDDRPTTEYFLSLPRHPEVDLAGLSGNFDSYVVE
jgi:spermidine synthase